MALRQGRGIHALTLSILLVAACSTGGTQSGAPLPGCNSGTKQALFWTSHTPPDTDSEQNIVNSFNKQSKRWRSHTLTCWRQSANMGGSV